MSPDPIVRGAEPRATKSLLQYVVTGLSVGLLGLVLFVAAVVIVIPRAAGATPVTVLTSSMEPTLPPGTLVVVKPKAVHDIRVGDVMTYQIRSGDPEVISHRVVGITSSTTNGLTFTTKGDNNAEADPPVVPAQVRGVVWYSVPLIGYVNSALDQSQRSWVLPAVGVLLILYAGWMFVRGTTASVRRRTRGAAGAEPAPEESRAPSL
ncbi:signal peptidase I [Leifsonia shinshuensis]|uniref:signal peptidase I n=1 Tax=Leifsonia shinshuensis TaxID=150026 RepID=UPI001CA525F0|nr:signal peptidase I [Leifsonia shinshuensis]